jgi:hypothetical protein
MPPAELADALAAYQAGLEAEMHLLNQLDRLSAVQQEATRSGDTALLERIGEERRHLINGLVAVEHDIRPARHLLADRKTEASHLEGFDLVVSLHEQAAELIAGIVSSDRETIDELRKAELARRFVARTVQAGENTLAAYRRVVAPRQGAALVDRKG